VSCIESYVSLGLGAVNAFEHFIAVSDFVREKVVSMGVPSNKVTTVHNFTDISRFEPDYSAGQYFLYFGRLENNKGVWQLLQAFRSLPRVRLKIVGTGSEEQKLKSYIRDNAIENVEMLGFLAGEALANAIRQSRCVIVPSTCNETFGLTITEAFAYGKPVIASRVGGIPEVISESEDGILVEPGSVQELADAINILFLDAELAKRMGRAGRNNVGVKFSKKAHYEKLMQVYSKVVY